MAGRSNSFRRVKIFYSDGNAVEWPAIVAGMKFLFGLLCLSQCKFRRHRDEAVKRLIHGFDSLKAGFR